MKRFIPVLLLLVFCFSIPEVFAFLGETSIPRSVPFTENGHEYSAYVKVYHPWYGYNEICYYSSDFSVKPILTVSETPGYGDYYSVKVMLNPASDSQAFSSTSYSTDVLCSTYQYGYWLEISSQQQLAQPPVLYYGGYGWNDWYFQGLPNFDLSNDNLVVVSGVNIESNVDWDNSSHNQFNLGSITEGQVIFRGAFANLSVIIDPEDSGMVTLDPDGGSYVPDTEVEITATPEDGFAFAYWDDGTTCLYDNPLTVTMDSAKTLTAKFFGIFRNAVGDFRQSSGDGDECVLYVRSETDILYDACHGEAADCFSQAQSAGYATSTTVPRIGSIIVFNRASGALSSGHVGIVTGINGTEITMQDSNWVAYHTIGSHTVDVSGYSIAGYIYYTP